MNETNTVVKIMRMKQIRTQTGLPPSTLYDHIKKGLFTAPIKMGERISGWLESEVTAIVNARIAGKSSSEIKALVLELEAQRLNACEVNA